MKDRTFAWLSIVVVVLIGLSIGLTGSTAAQSADSVVAPDGNGDYTSIQSAVSDSVDGDRIEVRPGTYEEDLYLSANVTIIAPNGAIIANTSTIDDGTGVSWQSPLDPQIIGFEFTGWRSAVNTGGPNARGNWEIRNSTIVGGSCAICAPGVEGDWTVANVTIQNAETPVSAYDSSGNWVIRDSTFQQSGEILAFESSGDWEIQNTAIHDATDNGINAGNSTGDWTLTNSIIKDSSSDGLIAENTAGAWAIRDTVIQDTEDGGIEVDEGSGNWVIENTTVEAVGDEGIDLAGSSGQMLIRGSTIRNTGQGEFNNAIRIEDSEGYWTIEDTHIENISGEGIDAYQQPASSQATIENLTVTDTQNHGVNFYESSGDWKLIESQITNSETKGVEASETTGNWSITSTTVETTGENLIGATGATGHWEIHNSKLTTGDEAIDATESVEGNASYNYWGAADGPSGKFSGSGLTAIGNLTVSPFYTDSGMIDTSSAISEDTNASSPEVPTDLEESVRPEQYEAVLDGDDGLNAGNIADAVNEWSANSEVNGVDIGAPELSDLINYWTKN